MALGFVVGALALLFALSALLVLLTPGGSGGGTTIDYEPISLEQAHSLIDSGRVHRIAIRPERNVDEFWLHLYYEDLEEYTRPPETSRRWKVDGVEVHLFTESMPTGVPILSDEQREVGITSAQLDDLLERVEQTTPRHRRQ